MPLYEYQCTECEASLEAIQAFSAPPLQECPECGQQTLKKSLSAPSFQFKGSGWYVSDYGRKGQSAGGDGARNGDGETSKSSSESESGSSESSGPSKTDSSSAGKSSSEGKSKPAAPNSSG